MSAALFPPRPPFLTLRGTPMTAHAQSMMVYLSCALTSASSSACLLRCMRVRWSECDDIGGLSNLLGFKMFGVGGGRKMELLISNNRDLLEVTTISSKPSELCGTAFVCRRLAAVRRFLASDPTAGLLIGWVSWARRKRISVVAGALETCDADRGRGYMHAIQGLRRCDAVAFVMHLRFLPPAESGRRTCHTRGLFRRFRVSAPRKTCSNTFRKIAARSCGSGGACGGT